MQTQDGIGDARDGSRFPLESLLSCVWPPGLGTSSPLTIEQPLSISCLPLSLTLRCGHRRGVFVEGVAVETGGSEAALEPAERQQRGREGAACCREHHCGADQAEPDCANMGFSPRIL